MAATSLPPLEARKTPPLTAPCVRRVHERTSTAVTTGVLTLEELIEIVDRSRGHALPEANGPEKPSNCLGLTPLEFAAVIDELERMLHIPLLLEALLCRSASDLVAFVNTQATSAA